MKEEEAAFEAVSDLPAGQLVGTAFSDLGGAVELDKVGLAEDEILEEGLHVGGSDGIEVGIGFEFFDKVFGQDSCSVVRSALHVAELGE